MTDPRPVPPSRKATGSDSVASLRLQLADRDRRLAELTEHSLQVLDRLANAREELRDRDQLREHIAKLQELLADTRNRIRAAGRAVLGPDPVPDDKWQLVVWGVAEAHVESFAQLQQALPNVPMTLLLADGTPPAPFALRHDAALGVLESGAGAAAQFWNQALASTQAEVLVLLHADAMPAPGAIEQLAAAALADGVMLASPRLLRSGAATLGRVDRGLLDLAPAACGEGDLVRPIPFASPEAFAIARSAFHRLGPFDQDLHTDLALAEWCLRGGARGLRCLGVQSAVVELPATVPAPLAGLDTDRIVVLARHMPQRLAAAAMSMQSFWAQSPPAVAEALRAAFRRLPHAVEFPAAVDLLVVQATSIADTVRELPDVRQRLRALAAVLDASLAGDPSLPELVERLQAAAATLRARAAESLVHANEVQARGAVIDELRADLGRHAAAIREQKDELLARAGVIDALKDEMMARERAIMSLRQELVHRQAEVDRLHHEIEAKGSLQAEAERLQATAQERADEIAQLQSLIAHNAAAIEHRRVEIEQSQSRAAALAAERDAVAIDRAALVADRAAIAAARDAARAERDALAAERDAARAELQQARQDALAQQRQMQVENERLLAETAQLQQQAQRLLEQVGRTTDTSQQLAAERQALTERTQQLTTERQQLAERTQQLTDETRQLTAETKQLSAEAQALAAEREKLAAARDAASARLGELEQSLESEAQRLQKLLGELETARTGNESLRREHGSLQEQRIELESRTHELMLILRDRERWIVKLLQEVAQRQLKLRPRRLSDHEREFLARHGQSPRS